MLKWRFCQIHAIFDIFLDTPLNRPLIDTVSFQ